MKALAEPVAEMVRTTILKMSEDLSPKVATSVGLAVIGGALEAIREIEPEGEGREAKIVDALCKRASLPN